MQPPSTARGYRPEIDGLRTLAVVPVVLFHAGAGLFQGGYVGVDVFFVISGYLITGIILREIDAGAFSIRGFYARRAKRILPALFTVMLCCAPVAWFWLVPEDFAKFAKSVVAVCLFVSNMWFWHEEGYFSTASELKPLIHTWSLAVEEQFYLLFPPFLVLASRLGRRFALRAVIFAAIASFALCEVAAVHTPTANFYLAPTRAWELLVGSACAFIGEQPQDRKGTAAGWLGFASIVAAIFLFSDDIPFPSHFAAAPVIGTALILVYARPESGIGRVLALPPFVGVGLISYSFYLWHQPLFAFARLRSRDEPGMATMLSLAVFALVLAWATWRFIERPFRRHDYTRQQQRRAAVLIGCSLAVFGAVGTYGIATDSVRWRLRPNLDPAVVELAATRELRKLPSPTCPPGFGDDAVPCLILPPPPGGRTVALFGDSLAEASLPAFLAAARAERVGLVFGFASGCPPFPGIYVYDGNYRPERCGERAMEEMEAARRFRADTVFLVARWTLYNESAGISRFHYWLTREPAPSSPTLAQSREVFAEALPRTVTAYRAQNQQVVLVRQLPQFELDVGRFVERLRYSEVRAANLPALTFAAGRSRTEFDNLAARSNRVLDSQLSKGTRIIDLGAPFTRGDRYVWSDGRESWYFDFAHVSVAGALQLVPQLRGALKANPVGNAPDAATADVRPSP